MASSRRGRVVRRPRHSGDQTTLMVAVVALLGVIAVALLILVSRGKDGEKPEAARAAEGSSAAAGTGAERSSRNSAAGEARKTTATPSREELKRRIQLEPAIDSLLLLADQAQELGFEDSRALALRRAFQLAPEHPQVRRALEIREFDADEDLPGLSDMRMWVQSYQLAPYLEMDGRALARIDREELIERWSTSRKQIERRHQQADNDPFLDSIDSARTRIVRLPFFDSLPFRVIEETRPFALFVEVDGKSEANDDLRAKRVKEAYQPFLEAFRVKVESFLGPLVDNPQREHGAFLVWVLKDRDSYARFFKEIEGQESIAGLRAHYSPENRWAFSYSEVISSGPELIEGVQAVLHELVHAHVDRLAPGGIRSIRSHWVNEGLAEYLSCWTRKDRSNVSFNPHWSARVSSVLDMPAEWTIPFEEVLGISNGMQLHRTAGQLARKRAGQLGPMAHGYLMSRFYADSYLFILWLLETQEGKYRQAFLDYLSQELMGKGGKEAFEAALPEIEVAEISREVYQLARRLYIDRVVPKYVADRTASSSESDAGKAPSSPHLEPLPATVLDLLAADALQGDARWASLWYRFVAAGFRDAASYLSGESLPLGQVMESFLGQWFVQKAADGKSCHWNDVVEGSIQAVQATTLRIGKGEQAVELLYTAIDPGRLAYALLREEQKTEELRVTAAALTLLGGDVAGARRRARSLTGESGQALQSLVNDPQGLLTSYRFLHQLDQSLILESSPSFQKQFAELWRVHQESDLAHVLRSPLRATFISKVFRAADRQAVLRSHLRGAISREDAAASGSAEATLPLNLHYDFRADAHVRDWPLGQGLTAGSAAFAGRLGVGGFKMLDWDPGTSRIVSQLPGSYGVLSLPVQGDLEIEVTAAPMELPTSGGPALFAFGVYYEGSPLTVSVVNQSVLWAVGPSFVDQRPQTRYTLTEGQPLAARLAISDGKIEFSRGSRSAQMEAPASSRARAHVFLLCAGAPRWFVSDLRLRGQLGKATLDQLTHDWAQVSALEIFGVAEQEVAQEEGK